MLALKSRRISWANALVFVIVILWIAVWLFPLWNILVSATKSENAYLHSQKWFFSFDKNPAVQLFQNVVRGLQGSQRGNGIGPAFSNSLIYSVVAVVLSVFFSALAAFALVCLPMKGRFVYFIILFAGTVFPLQVYLIPLFLFFQKTGLYDTKLALILAYTAICTPFCVFLLRNWYLDVPVEIFDASKIDGAGDLQIFLRIFMPLSVPPFVTLFLFQFTWVWNDFIFGMTFARSRSTRPIMALLAGLQTMYSNVGVPAVLASTIVASLPTVGLLIFFRNYFFRGLAVQYGGSGK